MVEAYVALLRGVNVGGKNRLPMRELAALFAELGCDNVATYIQSGNVIFTADPSIAPALPSQAATAIRHRFGFTAPVVVRSARDMARIVASNPFLADGQSDDDLHVAFLQEAPTAERIALLDPNRSPPDRFVVVGADVYLHTPNGQADTKLTTAYLDSRLNTVATSRNWRTTVKLVEMLAAQP